MSEPAETRQATPGESKHKPPLRPWQVISSVFAAGLGVQSSRNRERDLQSGPDRRVYRRRPDIYNTVYCCRGGCSADRRQPSRLTRHGSEPQVQCKHHDADDGSSGDGICHPVIVVRGSGHR